MKMVIDVADDIPLEKMQEIYDSIDENFGEFIVEMGWIVKGKFVKQLEEKEKEVKGEPTEMDKLFGPKKETKDPFENLLGPAKDKKDDDLGFL